MTITRALVLGGGGLAGIAWETGVLAGLADAGVDVTGADFVLGTSAGSTVAMQLGSGLPLQELFRRQADPAAQSEELAPSGMTAAELADAWLEVMAETADPAEVRRRLGALALTAATVPETVRLAVIAGRLPVHAWPDRPLAIVAVDALTGEPRVFDMTSGVDIVDAVAASCAVPGIWPPVTIAGSRYVDGGVRSLNNADLAAGHDRVLVLAPMPMPDPLIDDQVAALAGGGSRVEVVTPDEAARATFGDDPLDPATRTPAAHAGRAQGRRAAPVIARLWQAPATTPTDHVVP